MIKIKITFMLLFTTFSAIGQDMSGIKIEQPLLKGLFVWNGLVIAEKDRTTNDKYFICDTIKGRLTRLEIANDTTILALSESNSFLYAISKRGDSFTLLTRFKQNDFWTSDSLFPEFQKLKKFKLIANDSLLILVTSEKIYTKRMSLNWQVILIDSILEKSNIPFSPMPEHSLLTSKSLYLGFDKGEWGGALWEIPVTSDREKPLSYGKIILLNNIRALEYSSQDILWIATGLAHLSIRESGIYRYQNSILQQVLWSNKSLSLKEKSDLSAFCLRNSEDPFFVASMLGVFKISNDNLEEILSKKLYLTYNTKDYGVGSNPVGMHVDKNNTIYIAQRSLGVFVYSKSNGTYSFRQLTFD